MAKAKDRLPQIYEVRAKGHFALSSPQPKSYRTHKSWPFASIPRADTSQSHHGNRKINHTTKR